MLCRTKSHNKMILKATYGFYNSDKHDNGGDCISKLVHNFRFPEIRTPSILYYNLQIT